eukprot:GEMP01053207.1.p1 GENE.GEMP01053207.1~~GEMP01053207.1.p1  ORF type:complete len:244 (+),score=39.52 GEMP01053207.1:357-1088(+)
MELDRFHVHWWADAGTLLGAWRHQGLMPQECDIDFALWHHDVHLFANEGPLMRALNARRIRAFYLVAYRVLRLCYITLNDVMSDSKGPNFYTCQLPYIDMHSATYVPTDVKYWKYAFFPDSRYLGYFSLEGLLTLNDDGAIVADRREKWPFGETYVYVPEMGSPAAHANGYLGQVYGNDWRTTVRQRNPSINKDDSDSRAFVRRVEHPEIFYGLLARPTGPLNRSLDLGGEALYMLRKKRYHS